MCYSFFPVFVLGGDLIKADIAMITGLADLSRFHGGCDGTVGCLQMGAIIKAAPADMRSKLGKGILKRVLGDGRHRLNVK